MLFLIFEVLDQILLEVSGIADGLESHHVMLVFLHNAGQVIEGEDSQFSEGGLVAHVLRHLWEHDDIDGLRDELDVAALLLVLDVLHG